MQNMINKLIANKGPHPFKVWTHKTNQLDQFETRDTVFCHL